MECDYVISKMKIIFLRDVFTRAIKVYESLCNKFYADKKNKFIKSHEAATYFTYKLNNHKMLLFRTIAHFRVTHLINRIVTALLDVSLTVSINMKCDTPIVARYCYLPFFEKNF